MPAKSGSLLALAISCSVCRLQLVEVHEAALLGFQLETAGVAEAADRRSAKDGY